MKKILVTGGTVFVSRYIAEYYAAMGRDVYVLNRNTREQSKGVKLIRADRFNLGEVLRGRCFYLPKNGEMKLQFFHVKDLCRFIDVLLMKKPQCHIFNVGNQAAVSVRQWVEMCYSAAGGEAKLKSVYEDIDHRSYSFYGTKTIQTRSIKNPFSGLSIALYRSLPRPGGAARERFGESPHNLHISMVSYL